MGEPKIPVLFCLSFVTLLINQPNFERRIDNTPHFLPNPYFTNFVYYSTKSGFPNLQSRVTPNDSRL